MRIRRSCLACVAFAVAACGDDAAAPEVVPSDTVAADTATADSALADDTLAEPEVPAPRPSVLAYAQTMVASDGTACVATCALRHDSGTNLALTVLYRDADGNPLADRPIKFDPNGAPSGLATLSAFSVYTDVNGLATVTLRTYGLGGSLTVTASASDAPATPALDFVVTLDVPPAPALAASFEYLGHQSFSRFVLRLWKVTAGHPSCAEVHPDAGQAPAPDVVAGAYELGTQARVMSLPGLDTETHQTWTVQFIGPEEAAATPLAAGCVDNVQATAGETAQALAYVLDLPRHFRGTFDTVTRFDTVSGSEGTGVGTALSALTDLFTHPGRVIVQWACKNASGTLGTVCGWLVEDSGELTLTGGLVADAADSALLALLESAIGNDAQDASQIISELLHDLRLVAVTRFDGEPATPSGTFQGAYFAPGEASERWTHVRFRWKYDPSCSSKTDPDCGWAEIPLTEIYGFEPTADLPAGIDLNSALHVDSHAVTGLTYGPLMDRIIEGRLLSLFFATDGLQPVDSWDDFASVLFGDRLCLDYDDCCDYFAERIYDSVPYLVYLAAPMACEAAIPIVADAIRNQFLSLDGTLHTGTPPGTPCASQDYQQDRWVDAYGLQSAPCTWDMWFDTAHGGFSPDNNWRSTAQ